MDVDKLPVPVPDSTTRIPGRRPSLEVIIEISGVYRICVLCIRLALYMCVFGLTNVK